MNTIEIFLNNTQSGNAMSPFWGVAVGAGLTFLNNWLLENKKLKKERFLDNKRRIDLTYQEIYVELLKVKDYYYLFVESGNEFKESEDYQKFSPLNVISNFFNFIKEKEIFLDGKFLNEFQKLRDKIGYHPSMALQMAINPDLFNESIIESTAKDALEEIERFVIFLKKRFQEEI